MWTSTALSFGTVSLLLGSASAAGLYSKNSAVIQVDGTSYNRLIAQSNYSSIVEFYAPWCGHCKNLQPAYEKAAKNLQGLAKVAAVNCDEEHNKPFCGQMGIQGFPTLKIVRPGKKAGRPVVEDYQQARTAKAIVDALVERIPNHVKKLTDKNVAEWLTAENDTAKAILFSDKGTTSGLVRALAIDYLGSISFAQVRDTVKAAKETFGITSFPTLVLLPGGDKESIVYSGEMKKAPLSEFISQLAAPNPDPAPEEPKPNKAKKDTKKEKKASSSFSKASKSHKASDAASEKLKATSLTVESQGQPTESPSPEVNGEKPTSLEDEAPVVKALNEEVALDKACFGPKSSTCIIVLLPEVEDKGNGMLPVDAMQALASLGDIQHKYTKRGSIFPFYAIPSTNGKVKSIRDALSLNADGVEILAVNAKRTWYRRFAGSDYGMAAIDEWIDAIRMNEGKREQLPESLLETDKGKQKVEYSNDAGSASLEVDETEFKMQTGGTVEEAPPAAEAQPLPEATADVTAEKPLAADPEPPQEPKPEDVRDEL